MATTRDEFLAAFKGKPAAAWENAIVELAKRGEIVRWPLAPVTVKDASGRSLTFLAATDFIAVGTIDAPLRMPLTPIAMQKVADAFGMVLPTPHMVKSIAEQAPVTLASSGIVPNKGAVLEQYAEHNAKIEALAAGHDPSLLRSGHKKDLVLSGPALMKPRVVVIYGWMNRGPVPPGPDPSPLADAPWRTQPLSNVHGDFYVDYSHGGRLIHPVAHLTDASGTREVGLAEVYASPDLSTLVNPKGPIGGGPLAPRYPVAPGGPPIAYVPERPSFADRGLSEVKERVLERMGEKKGS